jgi:dihydrofolate synthase/folylpolyglutamate synthase
MQESLSQLLSSLPLGSMKLGLSRMQRAVRLFGHPERSFPSVHIAGTNGKGSTTTFLSTMLREAGYKVGTYTSPHMVHLEERIAINHIPIPKKRLTHLAFATHKKLTEANIILTYFEFLTLLAFFYFQEEEIDIAVIEVGLGGRLDATPIAKDHEHILGDTLPKIAFEKAGIIKKGIPILSAVQRSSVDKVVRTRARELHSPFLTPLVTLTAGRSTRTTQSFIATGALHFSCTTALLGQHQRENLSVALSAACYLRTLGYVLPDTALKKGTRMSTWPGRLTVLSTRPYVLLDGAHNAHGMEALLHHVRPLQHRSVLLFACSQDKDIAALLPPLAALFPLVILTQSTVKPADPQYLSTFLPKSSAVTVEPSLNKALALAEAKTPKHGTLLIAGSLYLAGNVLALWKKAKK